MNGISTDYTVHPEPVEGLFRLLTRPSYVDDRLLIAYNLLEVDKMLNLKCGYLIILTVTMLGCSTQFKVPMQNASGSFDAKEVIDEVKVNEKVDIAKYKKLLYVRSFYYDEQYANFLVGSFRNMHIFDSVIGARELEVMIIEKGLTEKVTDISNLIGLNQFQKYYGDYLIVDFVIIKPVGWKHQGNLKVIDPSTGKVILHLYTTGVNWDGLDQPIFYPLFNGFLDWANGKPIRTRKLL